MNTTISMTKYEFDLSGSQADYFFGLFSSVKDYTLKSNVVIKKKEGRLQQDLNLQNTHLFQTG